ncbi:YjbE family putative metal transport protein [Bradyrhizobium sp. Tv2a-2]|uniref:YjbE family putative metal transport protein n=1 Tax=Bradyrhizobium sp. Tv2a-2 TaxID=113395 RepID=UPI00041A283E|nr:YjbE family putative metal transport protein [Bradyrhizobium sp. Tv2a-2]
MFEFLGLDVLTSLFEVVLINLVLSGDNVIVISLAAAGLPHAQRGKAILIGIIAATALRVLLAGLATQILQTVGLLLAGGILLLWVCWKIWRELRASVPLQVTEAAGAVAGTDAQGQPRKTLVQAIWQITLADFSMSLDNVLAVAGAARDHPVVLMFGLALSIALMGAAASFTARLLQNHRWLGYVGLAIILYIAIEMTIHGTLEIVKTAAPVQANVPSVVAAVVLM